MMKVTIMIVPFLFGGILFATPDNDMIAFAGYEYNKQASDLKELVGDARKIALKIDLNKLDPSKRDQFHPSIRRVFEENSYFRFTDVSDPKGFDRIKENEYNNPTNLRYGKVLLKFVLDRYEIKKDFTEIDFTVELVHLENHKKLRYTYSNYDKKLRYTNSSGYASFPDENEFVSLLSQWKKGIFPSQELFPIEELSCSDPDSKIEKLLNQGCSELLDQTQDPGKSRFFFEKAQKNTENKVTREAIHNALGYHFVSVGNFKDAEEHFTEADRLNDSAVREKYKSRIEAVRALRKKYNYYKEDFDREISLNEILTQYKLKNFSVALALMNRMGKLDPSQNLALNYVRAHSYLQLKEYENALKQFLNILSEVPYRYEIYNNIGACYFYLNDYKNALHYFHLSKTENPNYRIAEKNYILLQNAISGKILEKFSDPSEFPEVFLVSSSAAADVSAGWFYFFLGRPVEAIHLFKSAIKSDPDYSLSYLSLGYLYDFGGNFKSAIKYYQAALKVDPDYPDVWNNLAISYYNDGQIKKAVSHFQKAIRLNPTFAYPVNNLGYIHLQQDDHPNAKKYFLRSIELNPTEPLLLGEIYAGLSICGFLSSEWSEAKKNKKRSVELHPNLSDKNYLRKELRWRQNIIDIFLNRIDSK